ncbi:MAG: AtpZ/AtpI family protein [Taibaiella sp.]|nr:AtpZ/AtpI family protein [Taibaiella sp.]
MKNKQNTTNAARYAGLATQWMAMLLVSVWLGYKLDRVTHWKLPLFLILFPLISLSLSLWQLVRELNKPEK